MQSVCSDCPVSSCVSLTSYDNIYLHVSVYTIFYLFTFLIAAQKILLIESAKASKLLQPSCAQQALEGGLGGGIVPPLAADGGSLLLAVQQQGDGNGGEESIEEEEPDNNDNDVNDENDDNDDTDEQDQVGEVFVCLNFSYSETLS